MIARLLTAALFLLAARWAYRAGYQAARLDALPWWRISRARKVQTLRYLDAQNRARSEQAFGYTSMSTVEVPTVRIAGGVPVVLNPSPGRRSASSRLSR